MINNEANTSYMLMGYIVDSRDRNFTLKQSRCQGFQENLIKDPNHILNSI